MYDRRRIKISKWTAVVLGIVFLSQAIARWRDFFAGPGLHTYLAIITAGTIFLLLLTALAAMVAAARTNGVTPGNMGLIRELHVITAVVIGGTVGLAAGTFGGWIDESLMRLTEFLDSIPGLLLALLVVAVWGAGVVQISLAIGIGG